MSNVGSSEIWTTLIFCKIMIKTGSVFSELSPKPLPDKGKPLQNGNSPSEEKLFTQEEHHIRLMACQITLFSGLTFWVWPCKDAIHVVHIVKSIWANIPILPIDRNFCMQKLRLKESTSTWKIQLLDITTTDEPGIIAGSMFRSMIWMIWRRAKGPWHCGWAHSLNIKVTNLGLW